LRITAPGWPGVTNTLSYPVVYPPPNDAFADRIPIFTSYGPTTVTGSNLNASKEAGEPYHADRQDGCSVWWAWTAPASGPVRMSTAGSGFDTLLAVYTGISVNSLLSVAANDDAGGRDYYSTVRFDAVAGTQYLIAVDGYVASQGTICLTVFPLVSTVSLGVALDASGLMWATGGHEYWLGMTDVTHDGADAARSGPMDAYGQDWVEATVVGPGYLSFWRKVSSEAGYDYLRFAVNGAEQEAVSGEADWQELRCWLGVGTNTLRWAYSKDESISAGTDAGWLDEVAMDWVAPAIPSWLGDLDRDNVPTVLDLSLLVGYLRDTNSLLPQVAAYADTNGDHAVNTNDVRALADAILCRSTLSRAADTDGDGIADVLEPLLGLNPASTNSVGDGVADAERDHDNDGLSNGEELAYGLDPLRPDTDGDGWWDEAEITAGSNPLDANSRPYVMVVSAPPVSFVLPANEGAGGLSNNTVVASPPVSFVLPANEGAGGLSNNTVIASPPVSFVLPANEGAGGLSNNTVVASPPVSFVLPASEGTGGLSNNTVIASPPVSFVLPVNEGAGGLNNNTFIAMPPVRIQIGTP
jgi:hypothetical protein